jgi:hypothetical protein
VATITLKAVASDTSLFTADVVVGGGSASPPPMIRRSGGALNDQNTRSTLVIVGVLQVPLLGRNPMVR